MHSKRSRLDRFLSSELNIPRKDTKLILAQGRVSIDGHVVSDTQYQVDEFSYVLIDGKVLQNKTPHYLMLHKPKGYVSATKDEQHSTVIDLLDVPYKNQLHIVGRLDFNSTGLLLLTNNGRWSRTLMSPENKVAKRYRVTVEQSITKEMVLSFAEGMYFSYENIMTQAAELNIISENIAEVTLREGRYHQIKRMFGHFQNKVLEIHRFAIGAIQLDDALMPGESRTLTEREISF